MATAFPKAAATGSPTRLPVLLFLAAALLGGGTSCSKGSSGPPLGKTRSTTQDEGFLAGGKALWDTPPLPMPTRMSIDGVEVPPMVVEGFLESPWAEACALAPEGNSPEQIAAAFYADGHARFGELVRGVLLLREAESQFPELADAEVDHYQEQMSLAAGPSVFDALERRYGADGVRAHVERRLRLTKLEAEFAKYAPEVTDDELYEIYDREVLAKLPESAPERENIDFSFSAMAPKLRGPLQQKKTRLEMEKWIDEHLGGVEVKVELADGSFLEWVEQAPPNPAQED